METGAFRQLLAADVAVELGVLRAGEAAEALAKYWEKPGGSVIAALPEADRARVEAEVERILNEAGGDAQAAVQRRGVDRELPASLAPAASHALSEAGARLRAPLRAMDKKRYIGFLPIGQGGMGVVYLALDSELNRRVAFKMIRSGATDPLADESGPVSDDMVARFMQEAVVTGGLEHPGIVPVYELGITPSGVPYYTMRLVRGEKTLDDAIKAAATIEERIGLLESFLKVCDAVGYAHSRGVIHRDLKPANIALGRFGEVVVLDWGLAKMHERPDLAGSRWQTRLTELREVTDLHTLTSALGTPGYMAPEAALGEISKIDQRSDVYSLGAILHKILTGAFPFEFGTFQEYIAKLSQRVSVTPDPQGLGRICVKALAPRREDRFGGVGELAAAIRSWQNESRIDREVEGLLAEAESALATAEGLDGEDQARHLDRTIAVAARVLELRPQNARGQELSDSARELRARAVAHREAQARRRLLRRVGVVGLATATAATIVVAVLLNARRKEAEDARAQAEGLALKLDAKRTEAEGSRARAEDLARFMLNDLHQGLVPVGRLDLLGSVAKKSLDYYASLPTENITKDVLHARATVLRRIGEVLSDAGDLDGSLESFAQAKKLWVQLGDRYELSVLLNLVGDVLQETGDLDGALKDYRQAAKIRRELGRNDVLPRCLDRIADVLMRKGEREPAATLYKQSLAVRRALAAEQPDDPERQRELAYSLEKLGDLERSDVTVARGYFEDALAIRRKQLAERPADVECQQFLAACVFRIGYCQENVGEADEAKESFAEALVLYRRLAEGDPTHAWHQRNMALTLEKMGRFDEALAVKRGLMDRDPNNTRAQHDVCASLISLADVAKGRNDLDGAMAHLEEALVIARELTDENEDIPLWREDLADVLSRMGDVDMAKRREQPGRKRHEEALAIRRSLADLDPKNAEWQRNLALSLDRLGRYEESLKIRRALVERDPNNVTWQSDLVWGLGRVGEKRKDPKYYEEAVPLRRKLPKSPSQQRELAFCLYQIGTLYEGRGELEKALPALREAEAVHRGAPGYEQEHSWWADAYFRVGYNAACAAAKEGDKARALKHLAEHIAWIRKHVLPSRVDAHLEHAREQDPDLASLRGSEEFEALFR